MSIPTRSAFLSLADLLLCLCICFWYAGTPAPDVNESHYLTKARHFWDPAFGSGDLFLESADAHWFFFTTVGWLTRVCELPVAAGYGRILVWSLIAIGWWRLATGFSKKPGCASLGLTTLLCAIDLGHLSGEWVVGGFEAKGIAYGLIFFAIGESIRNRWQTVWLCFGLASAFHVVVGAWGTATMLIIFALVQGGWNPLSSSWRQQWLWLILGGAFSLPGLIPALQLNDPSLPAITRSQQAAEAAQIYVYNRLPHHLSPLHFAADRWTQHLVWLVLVGIALALYARRSKEKKEPGRMEGFPFEDLGIPLKIVWYFALLTGLTAAAGLAIDCIGVRQPRLAAGLLRFYWFRWNDVAWPIAVTMTLVANAFEWCDVPKWRKWSARTLLLLPGLWLGDRYLIQANQTVPEADCRALLMSKESPEQELKTFEDWVAVCQWIRHQTPEGKIWITPRSQQSFNWYSHRAEVVNWKNVPQDASQIIEWSKRMNDVYRYVPNGGLIPNNTSQLMRLGKKYNAEYVLVDKRIYFKLPSLPLIYPDDSTSNSTYAIYKIPVADDSSSEPTLK